MGVEKEWGPGLQVRTEVKKNRGMSVPMRTGDKKHCICLWSSAWELRTSGSSSAGAHGNHERRRYVCSTVHRSGETQYLLVAKCVGVEDEWGPVLRVRTGIEKDGGYVRSTADGIRQRRHLLVAKCVGVGNECGPVLLVRAGIETDGGMSV